MNTRYRRTIWCNTDELVTCWEGLTLATSLFEHDDEATTETLMSIKNQIGSAIRRVLIWKRRCENGRLPLFIEVTTALAEILLQDAQSSEMPLLNDTTDQQFPNLFLIRYSYAAGIVRGVNSIADSLQRNRGYSSSPASVATLCSMVGLPLWVVDLRHDSAHNELPSLITLRLAAKTLLNFISEYYWEHLINSHRSTPVRERAMEILKEYGSILGKYQQDINKSCDQVLKEEKTDPEDNVYGAFSLFANSGEEKKKKPQRATTQKRSINSVANKVASKYVKQIPIDIGVQILLSYLLDDSCRYNDVSYGVLTHPTPDIPETAQGAEKMIDRYRPLLITIGRKWPGFIQTFLSVIIDYTQSQYLGKKEYEDDTNLSQMALQCNQSDTVSRKMFFLKHWFRYLLSSDFHHEVRRDSIKAQKKRKKPVMDKNHSRSFESIQTLKESNIHIQSLYDRCVEYSLLQKNCSHVKDLARILKELLETEEERGLKVSPKKQKITECDDDAISEDPPIDSKKTNLLTLEEMETLIATDETESDCTKTPISAQHESNLECWNVCERWEPCALGAIPIHLSSKH